MILYKQACLITSKPDIQIIALGFDSLSKCKKQQQYSQNKRIIS